MSATTYEYTDTHAVRRVRGHCGVSGQLELPLTVSSGSWFASSGSSDTSLVRSFVYYAAPIVSTATPIVGHLSGGGVVQLRGFGLEHGVEPACAFGSTFTPATYLPNNGGMQCIAPAFTAPASVALHVALNGQQVDLEIAPKAQS